MENEQRVTCPRCGQRKLLVENGHYGHHGPDPDGSLMCKLSGKAVKE